jgi:septal ring-binding cell division protein DamX
VAQAQDEGFHEIQLNGKQLVFLFMAATVVSVVIFLCGVLVGRGVRAERGTIADPTPVASNVETTPQPPAPAAAPAPTPAGSDPTKAAPPPAAEDLSYFNRLEKPAPVVEKLKPAPEKPAVVAARPTPPPPQQPSPSTPPPDETRSAAQASGEPTGSGFAVQIAALNVRSEAEAIAKRLSSKGYAAYVLSPATGTPTVYRVRVGKFSTRREAETVAGKLQKEEQFKPWITR